MPPSNDAQRVLEACGRPESDTVTPIYDKLHNGPVRRMIYHGRQVMELEFIPVGLDVRPGERAPAYAPPGTMWRFQSAHMQNREFVTSRHFDIYLPCAKRALADEL